MNLIVAVISVAAVGAAGLIVAQRTIWPVIVQEPSGGHIRRAEPEATNAVILDGGGDPWTRRENG